MSDDNLLDEIVGHALCGASSVSCEFVLPTSCLSQCQKSSHGEIREDGGIKTAYFVLLFAVIYPSRNDRICTLLTFWNDVI